MDYIKSNDIHGKERPLYVYDKNNELIKKYDSIKSAKQDGYSAYMIRKCCNNQIEIYNDLIWRYEEVC